MAWIILVALVPVLDMAADAAWGRAARKRRARRRAAELEAIYGR